VPKKVLLTVPRNMVNGAELFWGVNGAEKCRSSKQQLTVPKKVLLTVPRNMVNGAELFWFGCREELDGMFGLVIKGSKKFLHIMWEQASDEKKAFGGRVFDRGRSRRRIRAFSTYGVSGVLSGGHHSRSPAERLSAIEEVSGVQSLQCVQFGKKTNRAGLVSLRTRQSWIFRPRKECSGGELKKAQRVGVHAIVVVAVRLFGGGGGARARRRGVLCCLLTDEFSRTHDARTVQVPRFVVSTMMISCVTDGDA
jgi:hypothetical protein